MSTIQLMRFLLCSALCLMMFNTYAQQTSQPAVKTDTLKKPTDSIPKKYQGLGKRSPALAFVQSVFVPGLGQVYNRQVTKGVVIFGVFATSFVVADVYRNHHKFPAKDEGTVALLMPCFMSYAYSFIDAPITASALNRKYQLGQKKNTFTSIQLSPGLISAAPGSYTVGLSLVIR